jgi:integration host factor subunit beta
MLLKPIRGFAEGIGTDVVSYHKEEVMNKSGLIEALSRKENLTEKKAIDVVSLVFKGFTDELKKSGRIEIRGFGSFVVRKYDAYTGRNPKTGKSIKVSPKKLPFFKVGKELKERVDKKK